MNANPTRRARGPVDPAYAAPTPGATVRNETGDSLRILMVAPELDPFVKTGGLADVVSSLAAALNELGHDVRCVIPRYGLIDPRAWELEAIVNPMGVWMGNVLEWCSLFGGEGRGAVPVYFVEFNRYFDRPGLYHGANMQDYADNALRFGFLARAALQGCIDTGFSPHVVHAHDWQTALTSAFLKTWFWNSPLLGGAASALTIHNIAHQGVYSKEAYPAFGLGETNFTPDKFEDHGRINMLKGGIHYSDLVTTVSPGHAREVLTPEGGFGLAPYLSDKGDSFLGILNGVDYSVWSPEIDPLLPARFSAANLEGKRVCKEQLQREMGLAVNPEIPIFAAIGRFVDQKGFHLLAEVIGEILRQMTLQFVILGTGQNGLEHFFGSLPARFPGRAGSFIGFNNRLAHLIEAGSDFFVMPSLFEPCGLNQLYSLRYGTLPVVRATGGLDDTISNYDESTGNGNGFKFHEASSRALYYALGSAVSTYYDRPDHMKRMIARAMSARFSWQVSAQRYVEAYRKALANKGRYDVSFH